MKKLTIISILGISLVLTGCIDKKISLSPEVKNNEPVAKPLDVSENTTSKVLSDSQDGVEITIENIRKENNNTILELVMNNHRYDLGVMDALSSTSFNGVKPSDYIVKSSAMGGHHVNSEMFFEGDLIGPLTIGLGETLTFNFNIE